MTFRDVVPFGAEVNRGETVCVFDFAAKSKLLRIRVFFFFKFHFLWKIFQTFPETLAVTLQLKYYKFIHNVVYVM